MSDRYNGVLHLFTTRFPYGITESFLENELPFLVEHFQEVRIYPMFKAEGSRKVPNRVQVIDLFDDPYRPAGYFALLQNFALFSRILKAEKQRLKGKASERQWAEVRSSLRQNLQRALTLKNALGSVASTDLFYSYWTFDWATVLSFLTEWRSIDGYTSRVHGFDLYEERSALGAIPFRSFQLKNANKVVAVSRDGFEHLNDSYPEHANKFHLSHLGVKDRGEGPIPEGGIPHVVSCSNVIPLKRVGLVAESLRSWGRPVRWTHFGAGKGFKELETIVADLPINVQTHLRGAVPNEELIEFYRSVPVDLFIHLSSSEGGVSVAMQEAASFGIPLLGCDVGGVPEICNERTGTLLPADPTIDDVVAALQQHFDGPMSKPEIRGTVRNHWMENFNAARVFPLFCQLLAR